MLNGIISNINSLFSRGKVTLIDNAEALQVQQVELHKGQVRSEIYAPQQYCIETAPHVGADVAIEGINPKEVHRIWFLEKDGKILIETDETVQIVCKDADIDVSHDATINVDNDVTAVIGNNLTATVALNTTLTTTTCNLNVLGTMAVVCPATTWLGNIVLTGNILQTGSITSTDDHVAGTISLQGHVHAGDGGTGSGPDTGAPL